MHRDDDAFGALAEAERQPPQVRIYLLGAAPPPVAALRDALSDYRMIVPRSPQDIAFVRRLELESELRFRLECDRVAALLAPLVGGGVCLSCVYDNAAGRTEFQVELQKGGGSAQFTERR